MTELEVKNTTIEQKIENGERALELIAKQLAYQKKYREKRKAQIAAGGIVVQKFVCHLCGKVMATKSTLGNHLYVSKIHAKKE